MNPTLTDPEIAEAVSEIISGKIVKRSKHLLVWEGRDIEPIFMRSLIGAHFKLTAVEETATPVGFRSPAFIIRDRCAFFGWLKWMKYDENVYWKFFGSEVRRPSGSPLIIVKASDKEKLYVNDTILEEQDPDAPPAYA